MHCSNKDRIAFSLLRLLNILFLIILGLFAFISIVNAQHRCSDVAYASYDSSDTKSSWEGPYVGVSYKYDLAPTVKKDSNIGSILKNSTEIGLFAGYNLTSYPLLFGYEAGINYNKNPGEILPMPKMPFVTSELRMRTGIPLGMFLIYAASGVDADIVKTSETTKKVLFNTNIAYGFSVMFFDRIILRAEKKFTYFIDKGIPSLNDDKPYYSDVKSQIRFAAAIKF